MWAVDVPPQLGYYYPPAWVLLPPAWVLLPPQLGYCCPPQLSDLVVKRRSRSCTKFSSISFAEPSLFYVLLGSRPDGAVSLRRCYPPRFCDFLEDLVVGDGVKTLGLHLSATCRGVVLLIFGSVYFRSYMTVSSFQDDILFVLK